MLHRNVKHHVAYSNCGPYREVIFFPSWVVAIVQHVPRSRILVYLQRALPMEASLALTFCFTSRRVRVLGGVTGAGLWNGPKLSRTISKLGTISNLAGTISFFRKMARTIQFFWKNCWNYFDFSEKVQILPFSTDDTGTFLSNSLPLPVYSALSAHGTEMKRLKVKHDNCTKRPHIPGTSTRAQNCASRVYMDQSQR